MSEEALAIPGALSDLECQVLGEVAAQSTADRALEVGHFHGRSTVVLLKSLPRRCALTTVDHHSGDQWSSRTDPERVLANMTPHVGAREFEFVDQDMLGFDYVCEGGFGFVFYDADHSFGAVSAWWLRAREHLAPSCTLVWDDADWEDQSVLLALAVADGFRSVRDRPFYRDPGTDKWNPETYTLEVMRRDA